MYINIPRRGVIYLAYYSVLPYNNCICTVQLAVADKNLAQYLNQRLHWYVFCIQYTTQLPLSVHYTTFFVCLKVRPVLQMNRNLQRFARSLKKVKIILKNEGKIVKMVILREKLHHILKIFYLQSSQA